jgi:translation initiation factor eIF-2B subunit alpha/methylthioribose-1-phosphate isomerase
MPMKVNVDGEVKDVLALWREGSDVQMVDQRKLPHKFEVITLKDHKETANAIKVMVTRGAGSIGCAAGFGMAQAAMEAEDFPEEKFLEYLNKAAETIRQTRPTAENLFKAVDQCLKAAEWGKVSVRVDNVVKEADRILADDIKASEAIAKAGAKLIKDGYRVMTHCNAGALAYIDQGTALAPIREAVKEGKEVFVWVNETRPRGQGARITAWELEQEGIPYALIADNAAGYYMQRGEVDMVIVGADRIVANGDVANKIGTYEKAVVAFENKIPFWVAAPGMTFDLTKKSGEEIEIEERGPEEVTMMWGLGEDGEPTRINVAGEGTKARNPAFDVTPAKFIDGFITEYGLIERPFTEGFYWLFGQPGLPPGFKYAGT